MEISCNIDSLQESGKELLIAKFHNNQMHDVLLAFNALVLRRISTLRLISSNGIAISIYSKQDKIWARCEPKNNQYLLSADVIELILCFCVDAILKTYEGVHIDLEFDDLDLTLAIE